MPGTSNKSSDIRAPFTPEQVEALNEYQQGGWMHPFTCAGWLCDNRTGLVATMDGWICPDCDYTQDWAHPFMVEGPPEWFRAFNTRPADDEWHEAALAEHRKGDARE